MLSPLPGRRAKMVEVMIAVHFSRQAAEQIADAVLADPGAYGF
jgi:hypothetical protein